MADKDEKLSNEELKENDKTEKSDEDRERMKKQS